jgi:hypothetical protein
MPVRGARADLLVLITTTVVVKALARHANDLNGMTSWRSAVTLALGRNTGRAILQDAGIQCSHGTPSIEAAARTVDAGLVGADPELGHGDFEASCRTAV